MLSDCSMRLLLIEDSELDAELIFRELRKAGYTLESVRVSTLEGLRSSLSGRSWDVVLSDHNLPGFNSLTALKMVQDIDRDIPFIIVSGTIGEEEAVSAMKGGAHDYILKSNLKRLVPAIEREYREAEVRRAKHRADDERTLAMARLKESESKLRRLVDSNIVGIFFYSKHDIITFANDAFLRILGYSKEDLEKKQLRWIEMTTPQWRETHSKDLQDLASQGAIEPFETELIGKSGVRVPVLMAAANFEGSSAEGVAFVLDITEQKRAIQVRDEFLSICSHELKTPITAMALQISSFQRKILKSGQAAFDFDSIMKLVEKTQRQIERLSVLIEEMLSVSRIATGRMQLHIVPTDLSELILDAVEAQSAQFEVARVPLEINIDHGVRVSCDPVRLDQVVTNLLSNALKYGEGRPVKVTLEAIDGHARITVTDQGLGIAPNDIERVFDRFERAIPSSSISGLGLGLYISREIMRALGGTIELKSELGQGSSFTIDLPLLDARKSAA